MATKDIMAALAGVRPGRIPFVPKIWVDLAAALTDTDIRTVIEDPLEALAVILKAGRDFGLDAVRQFPFPARRLDHAAGGDWVEVDGRGNRLGRIDLAGGLQTLLDRCEDYRLEDPAFAAYYNFRHAPGPVVRSLDQARAVAVPGRADYEELGWGRNQRAALRRVFGPDAPPEAGPMIFADCGSIGISFCHYLNGMDTTLTDLFDDPALVRALMDKGVAIAAERGKYWLGQGYRVLRINDSAGNMSVISPDHWREFVLPGLRDLVTELHRHEPSCRLYCHICGSILPIMKDLVESGLDCIAPLDPLGGFSVAQARELVGGHVALMGGIDTQSFVRSTPGQMVTEARWCVEGAGGCGFILGSGCVVPRTARPENLRAVVEWTRTYTG